MKLHGYQEQARDFLRGRDRAGLFLDMGLDRYARPMSTCQGCGEAFDPNYPTQKYHTHACFVRAMNSDRARQRAKGVKGGAVRGQQMRDNASGLGYVKGEGGHHEHRLVAARVLGRRLNPGEVVHHEDLNKQNNDPSNLIVFVSQSQHARHHKLGHPGQGRCDCYGIRLKEVMPDATS